MSKILDPAKRYVVGFVLSTEQPNVLLIRKERPTWQQGKLNGIGGQIEDGETAMEAVAREFAEECEGLTLTAHAWSLFASVRDARGWWIDFFYAWHSEIEQARGLTDEQVEVIAIADIHRAHCLPNLRWLIPMALSMSSESHDGYEIQERANRAGNQAADAPGGITLNV